MLKEETWFSITTFTDIKQQLKTSNPEKASEGTKVFLILFEKLQWDYDYINFFFRTETC